jgi:peptide-methionine (S)-S-oxide reductase
VNTAAKRQTSFLSPRYGWLIAIAVAFLTGLAFAWPRDPDTSALRESERHVTAKPLIAAMGTETATFAGGCFWGVEQTLRGIPGVVDARSGFTGGTSPNPTYETVHQDKTGYVEAVQVLYDPKSVSYETLLKTFVQNHDATPSASVGRQYRAFVFTHSREQEQAALHVLAELNRTGEYRGAPRPLAPGVRAASKFYTADEYHQRYYAKRDSAASCRL